MTQQQPSIDIFGSHFKTTCMWCGKPFQSNGGYMLCSRCVHPIPPQLKNAKKAKKKKEGVDDKKCHYR